MMSAVARRVGVALGAGVLLAAAWTGTAAASTTHAAPATHAVAAAHAGTVRPMASGTKWCGFDYDTCVQSQNTFRHYGYQVGPLYWAGTDNTCIPGHDCNGYWFDWWE